MKRLIESSVIDKELVSDLDLDILELALSIFIKNAEQEINELSENFLSENFTKVKSLAHKLGGSSITVGLKKVSLLSQIIENKEGKNILKSDIKNLRNEFLLIKELVN